MAGWHHWLDGCESEWTPGVGDGQGGLVCCDSQGRKESDTTERLNWTELNWMFSDVDIFSCDFLRLWIKFTCWNWLLPKVACHPLGSFSMTTPRTFFEGSCCWLTVPGSLWMLNAQQHSSSWCYYRKWPQGGSTSSHHMLFLFFSPVHSLLSSIAIEWISDVVCFRCTGTWFSYT